MTKNEILKTIFMLSQSQGLYGRLYSRLMENDDAAQKWLAEAESQNFQDTVDLILWIES